VDGNQGPRNRSPASSATPEVAEVQGAPGTARNAAASLMPCSMEQRKGPASLYLFSISPSTTTFQLDVNDKHVVHRLCWVRVAAVGDVGNQFWGRFSRRCGQFSWSNDAVSFTPAFRTCDVNNVMGIHRLVRRQRTR